MKKWLFIVLFACLVGSGLYFWWGLTGVQPLQEKALTFETVSQVTIRDTISATGMVEARELVFVSSEMPGTVMRLSPRDEKSSIPLGIGDSVVEGQVLAQLDERKIKLKVEEAEAGVALAQSAIKQAQAALMQAEATKLAADRYLDTQVQLQKAGGFKADKDQAEAQVKAASAGIKVAEAGIDAARGKKLATDAALNEAKVAQQMTRIAVPNFSSANVKADDKRRFLILDRKANVGQMVGPQSGPLFTLAASLDVVEVHAQVVEGDVNKIAEGLKAYFKVNNFSSDGESEFEGVVDAIRPLATNIKGATYVDVVIKVTNRREPKTGNWLLRPGMTASVDIVRHEHANAWRVPSQALNFRLEAGYQSEAVKARIAEWNKRPDHADWRTLWTWDESTRQPQPVFVRIGAMEGEIALKDAEGNEILEWEPDKTPTGPLRVIIGAPPVRPPGFFDQPANVKI